MRDAFFDDVAVPSYSIPFMQCALPYGERHLEVPLPASAEVLEPARAAPLADAVAAVGAAVRAPLDTQPLADLAAGKRTACIVISDGTRPAVGRWVLPCLETTLRAAGLQSLEILIATGTHRAAQPHEIEALVGTPQLRLPVRSHDAVRGPHEHVGHTAAGTPVWIDRGFLAADVRVVVGVVEPHLMAGYSGGAKSVCPGIARRDTIRAVHRASVARERVGPGIVRGNPFRREVEEAAQRAGVDFSVQCCVSRRGQLTFVAAGALEASVARATQFAAEHATVSLKRPFDVVVVSGGGAPLDRTLYQAAKGWATGVAALRPGGDVILVAEMADGVGQPGFAALLDAGLDAYEADDENQPVAARTGQWMLQHILQARGRGRLHVVCSLPEARLRRIGFVPHASVDAALVAVCGTGTPRVLVLPHGPYCVPMRANRLVTLEGVAVA